MVPADLIARRRPRRSLARLLPLFVASALAGCDGASTLSAPAADGKAPKPARIVETAYAFDGEAATGIRTPRGLIVGNQIIHGGFASGWYRTPILKDERVGNTRRITGEGFALTIETGECRRSALDPDRVIAHAGPYAFELCGGARVPLGAVAGTSWQLKAIDSRKVPHGQTLAATLTFRRDGKIEGTRGCNDMGSTIRWRDGRFHTAKASITPQTLLPCEDQAAEETGKTFWQKFRAARGWKRDGERLTVRFSDGTEAGFSLLL